MKITRPQSRDKYAEHINKLLGQCAFCSMSQDLTIRLYDSWTWVFAAFPYRKYHTLLVPKRHILKFADLEDSEILELKEIIEQIEIRYKDAGVIGENSIYGDQLLFSWKSRQDNLQKKPVAHLHLHIYPKFGGDDNLPLDADSHNIDTSILK